MKFDEKVVKVNFDREKSALAIDKFLAEQTGQAAYEAVVQILASSLQDFGIKEFKIVVEKLHMGLAYYQGNTIHLSQQLFSKRVDVKKFEKILKVIYHEFSHHLIETYNLKFIATRNTKYPFNPPFDFTQCIDFCGDVLGLDLETKIACAQYFYIKNKDENLARKNSVKYAQKYLDMFSMDYQFVVEPYESEMKRLRHSLYKNYELLQSMPDFPIEQVEAYQIKTIKNLQECTEQDIKNLLYSFELCMSDKVKQQMVDQLVQIKDNQKCLQILKNPNVTISPEQHYQLKTAYSLFVTCGAIVKASKNSDLTK